MPTNREQKIRLLVLYDLLCRYTDEEHVLSTSEIMEKLSQSEIEVSRNTLYDDINLLNEYGYEVLSYKKIQNCYYVIDRKFATAELSMFANALAASKLTVGQKSVIAEKLSGLVGKYQADDISSNMIFFDMPKRSNSQIIYNIDAIEKAIKEGMQISFKYFSLDENKQRVYRKDGARYIVNPLVMVWNRDNYYLVCYHDNHDGITNYRMDRIENVRVEITPITPRPELSSFSIEKYRKQVFSMFGGELKHIELQFERDMIDDIYDKFGEDIKLQKISDGWLKCNVEIQISPTFFSWLAGTRGKVKILTPNTVREQFEEFVKEISKAYI